RFALHKPREEIMLSRTTVALILAASLSLPLSSGRASADAIPGQFLVVELEIDPAQLEPYKAAIKENGETACPRGARMSRLQCGLRKGQSHAGAAIRNLRECRRVQGAFGDAALQEVCRDHEGHGQVAQANR